MAAPLERHLADQGAHLHLGGEVVRFTGEDRLEGVELGSGDVIPAQVAVVAIGVRPELTLARDAGLEIGASGGVVVDDRMQTSDPAIYACGDVAEVTNRITGKKVRLPWPGRPTKRDPVIMAGFVAANEWRKEVEVVTAAEMTRQIEAGEADRILDVRSVEEYEEGHIPGAELATLDQLRDSLGQMERDGPITVYCGVGYRSYHAYKILEHHGHQVRNLSGGFTSWAQAYPERIEIGITVAVSPAP